MNQGTPEKFVIFASQRTGSNMLVATLNSIQNIDCHGELFRRNKRAFKGAVKVFQNLDSAFLDENYLMDHWEEFLERVYSLSPEAQKVGFKLMLNQNHEVRDGLLMDADVKKILLKRENLLAVYSSDKIAKATKQGVAGRFADVATAKIKYSEREFTKFIEVYESRYDQIQKRLHDFGADFLSVTYLEICEASGIQKILNFLGVDPSCSWDVPTKKRNPAQMVDRFANPEIVERSMLRLGHSSWLTE